MKFVKTIVLALAACSIALPAAASADSLPATGPAADLLKLKSGGDAKAYSIQPQTGSRVPVPNDTEPAAGFRGDAPTTIELVRPERTIVRDVDETLPLILSGTALLLVLAGVGFTLVRTRMEPRPGRGH
jgi:hypothetical protein